MKKITSLLSLCALLASSPGYAQLGCDRACLTGYVDTWFQGLTTHNTSGVPLAGTVKITENNQLTDLPGTYWDNAQETIYRWDIVNPYLGDTGTEAIILNADGSKTMVALRLKVVNGAITEIESIKANEGDADRLWGPDELTSVSPHLQLSIRTAEQDSHYALIAAAEGYWRAFQTNGTPDYHPAAILPDSTRWENGLQTTGKERNGVFNDTAKGFHEGSFIGRNLWDRRYPVVDAERGIVMSIVRFGLKDGMESQSVATSNSRLVAEFFAIKKGWLQEIHAVLFNYPENAVSPWAPEFGPPRGGW